MCNDMQVALRQFMTSQSRSDNKTWFGYFSPLKVILGAKVANVVGDSIYFNMDDEGGLWYVSFASDVWMSANISAIRVVAIFGKKCFQIHPLKNA